MDSTVRPVGLEREACVAVAQLCECRSLPVLDLSAVGREPRSAERAVDRAEGAASFNLGELTRVADQDHLCASSVCVIEEAKKLAGADHGRLVDDDHVAIVDHRVTAIESNQKPVERARRNTRRLLETGCRPRGQRASAHLESGCRPRVRRGRERRGLPRTRDTLDDVDTRPRAAHHADHPGLLLAQSWVSCERGGDRFRAGDAGVLVPARRGS